MTFFSHRLYFVCLLRVSVVLNLIHVYNIIVYDPFLDQKLIFQKKSSMTPFLSQFVLRVAFNNSTSRNTAWGNECMGRPPPQIFGRPSPQFPLSLSYHSYHYHTRTHQHTNTHTHTHTHTHTYTSTHAHTCTHTY